MNVGKEQSRKYGKTNLTCDACGRDEGQFPQGHGDSRRHLIGYGCGWMEEVMRLKLMMEDTS